MKLKARTGLLAILFLLGLSTASYAGQEGHGGDMAVSLFLGIAQQNLNCLEQNPQTWLQYPSLLTDLQDAVQRTQVISVEKTLLNGVEVDAINYPNPENPQILLNRTRWLENGIDIKLRSNLVVHEYLSIAGYEDRLYQISYKLIEKNSACLRSGEL